VLVVSLLFLSINIASCRKHTAPYPHVIVPQTAYDFSQLNAGAIVTHDFYIKNDGGKPLLIEGIMSPCRCIFASAAHREIKPQGDIVLSVRLDTKGLTGPIAHRIIVYTNAANERVLVFKITASVKQLFSLRPENVDFGDVTKSSALSQTVVFTSTAMAITSAASVSPYIKTSINDKGRHEYDIKIKLDKGMPAGLLKTHVVIHTTSAQLPVLSIDVKAKKIYDLQANPDEIFSGILLKGRESSVFSTYIFTKHKKPFTIKQVFDTGNYLDLTIERLAPDIYRINISAKPFQHAGEYTSDIMVLTTDKETPVFQIPFRIMVMDK
jgi:hypothetical protein